MGKREDMARMAMGSDEARRSVEKKFKEALLLGKMHTAARYCRKELEETLAPKDQVAHISLHVALSWVGEIMDAFRAIDAMYANPEPMTQEEASTITQAGEAILETMETAHRLEEVSGILEMSPDDFKNQRDQSRFVGMDDMPDFFKQAFAEKEGEK